jgi:outer membrane protein assembly factor BamA
VGTTELRVPILLAGKAVGKLPLLLDKLATHLFWEVGGGWSQGEQPAPTDLMDAGGEVVTDLGIGAGLLLRARLGAAVVLRDGLGSSKGDVRIYLALGQSF